MPYPRADMSVISSLIKGMISVITVTAAPQMYRYPYRTSAEGLRGDMLRVGEDIEAVVGRLQEATQSNEEE